MGYQKGQLEYQKFKDGKRLTYRQACLAKCYECMCGYDGGKVDCTSYTCPIYNFYPYHAKKPNPSDQI